MPFTPHSLLDRVVDPDAVAPGGRGTPGKSTVTTRLAPRPPSARDIARELAAVMGGAGLAAPPPAADPSSFAAVQREAAAAPGSTLDDPFSIHLIAREGVAGGGGALPHAEAIQASFGHHDVGGVRAHVGGAAATAARAIGAAAYASGDDVAFSAAPDLRQAAHETAHVVQQRGGVRLDGGVGARGDTYEQHADAVADLVVRGESAEALLDTMAHRGSAGGPAVQRVDDPSPEAVVRSPEVEVGLEGRLELYQRKCMPDGTRIPVGPFLFFTGLTLDGIVDYRIGPPAGSSGDATPPPDREVHVGAGGARGHGAGHSHAAGIQAELAQHVVDLFGHGHLDVTVGGELSSRGGSAGVGFTGGNLRFGDFVMPLPSVVFNVWQQDWGQSPRIGVLNVTLPLPASYAFHMPIPGVNGEVELIPHGDVVLEFEPNMPAIIEALGGPAAAETALATEAGGGLTAIGPAVGLAATIGAPLAAGAALAAIFAHETGEVEDLGAHARGQAHTVFNYCMAYTLSWFDSVISGTGAAQGAAAGAEDVAAWRAAHPGATRTTDSAATIYAQVFDAIRVVAETSLRRSVDAAPDSLEDQVIRDAVGSVRWGGRMFNEYVAATGH